MRSWLRKSIKSASAANIPVQKQWIPGPQISSFELSRDQWIGAFRRVFQKQEEVFVLSDRQLKTAYYVDHIENFLRDIDPTALQSLTSAGNAIFNKGMLESKLHANIRLQAASTTLHFATTHSVEAMLYPLSTTLLPSFNIADANGIIRLAWSFAVSEFIDQVREKIVVGHATVSVSVNSQLWH